MRRIHSTLGSQLGQVVVAPLIEDLYSSDIHSELQCDGEFLSITDQIQLPHWNSRRAMRGDNGGLPWPGQHWNLLLHSKG